MGRHTKKENNHDNTHAIEIMHCGACGQDYTRAEGHDCNEDNPHVDGRKDYPAK